MLLKKTYHLHEVDAIAKEIISKSGKKLFFLKGDLGSGKTTLAKSMLFFWGIEKHVVNSPTFSIINEYETPHPTEKIYHLDLYRLNSLDQEMQQQLEEIFLTSIALVEWPKFESFFSLYTQAQWIIINPTMDNNQYMRYIQAL